MKIVTSVPLALALLAAGALLSIQPSARGTGNQNPGVAPANSSIMGKTYGEWAAAWWQWALSSPAAINPEEDTTGQYAAVGQNGPLWFLGGTFGDLPSPVVRTFTVPPGKALMVPVYFWIFGSCAGDCDPSNPGVPCDVPSLAAAAKAAATSIQQMEVTVDGVAIQNVRGYHTSSPAFGVTLPQDNVLEQFIASDVAGTYFPQVADGYWVILTPLAPGQHTIHVRTVPDPNLGSEQRVTYNITVR